MIRYPRPDEFPRLLEIQTKCIYGLSETYTPRETQAWAGYLRRATAIRYEFFENAVYIEEHGTIAAFCSWTYDEKDRLGSIECLYTLPDHRGRGAGRLLLNEAEKRIRSGATIRVRSTLNARSFYEQNGYTFIEGAFSRVGFAIDLLEKNV